MYESKSPIYRANISSAVSILLQSNILFLPILADALKSWSWLFELFFAVKL